jgi:hypothetical protein
MYASKLEYNDTVVRGITIMSAPPSAAAAGSRAALARACRPSATAARCAAEDTIEECNLGGEKCMPTCWLAREADQVD